MPRNICLAFGRFGSLFLLTSSVSADELFILSGCCSSSSLAIPMASTSMGLAGASRTFYHSARELRQASVLGRFAGAYVVSFNTHNLDQIPKRIPSEET